MRHFGPPYGLGDLVSDRLEALGLEQKIREQRCLLIWDEVVGPQVAGAAQPEFARDGILFVVTKSAVWSNELTFMQRDILDRLNRKAGSRVLKDMVFKVGRIQPRSTEPSAVPDEHGLEGIPLTDEELVQVDRTACAAGEGAADSVRALLITAIRLEKWKKERGWTPCRKCGALQNGPSGICPMCRM